MANLWGIHLSNGAINDESCFELGCSHFTLLHHQGEYVKRCREVSPDGIILVRFYLPNWSENDPEQWARECAQAYAGMAEYNIHVTPANEMNLTIEGGGWTKEWYQRIRDWTRVWAIEFQRFTNCPKERMHFPAFGYGHDDDWDDDGDGIRGMEICRPAIDLYGILDVHPYWFEPEQITSKWYGHRFILAHEMFPDKPIFCSETGNFAVDRQSTPEEMIDWFESLYEFDYIVGGTPFIWSDPSKAHWQNDWSRNPEIAKLVAAWPKKEVKKEEDVTMANYAFTLGFASFAQEYPEVGLPTSELMYDAHGNGFQYTEAGKLEWNRERNQVLFFRASLTR